MTNQEITEKVYDIFDKATVSPKKYLRLVLSKERRTLCFNGEMHAIDKCTLCYRDRDNRAVQLITDTTFFETNDFTLVFALRPKKHLAVAIEHNQQQLEKYFRLDEEHDTNDDYFVCIIESQRETFLLACLHGMYFLRTFDEAFPITLYDLIHFLLAQPQETAKKEVDDHGEEKETLSGSDMAHV